MTSILLDGVSYFVSSCFYSEIFVYAVANRKLHQGARIKLDHPADSKPPIT